MPNLVLIDAAVYRLFMKQKCDGRDYIIFKMAAMACCTVAQRICMPNLALIGAAVRLVLMKQTCDGRKEGRKDGRTDGRTDGGCFIVPLFFNAGDKKGRITKTKDPPMGGVPNYRVRGMGMREM